MLLRRLAEYSDTLDLPPTLYRQKPVRYIIEIDQSGRLLSSRPTDTADPASPMVRKGAPRMVPEVQRTSGIKALLLADKADYTLGPADAASSRKNKSHEAYLDLVSRCVLATRESCVSAVLDFLKSGISSLELPDDFDRGATIVFRVGEVFPTDLPTVQAFWAAENDPAADPDRSGAMQCVVCGELRPVLKRLQAKLKGIPGGQTSGTSLISANAPAFESYGLEASLIAPTCSACGERFTRGANALLADPSRRIFLGGTALAFWTRTPSEFSFVKALIDPDPADVVALIRSVTTGRPPSRIDADEFYGIALSASGGRAVVRDWIDTTVLEAKRRLSQWFAFQSVVGPNGETPKPLGIRALCGATVREFTDLSPSVPRALVRSALTGAPLPHGLLFEAVRRNRAEQRVTRPRAALIKLVLTTNSISSDGMEGHMIELDADNPSAAYRCGRLLAVLEQIQRAALPTAKATIVDRFFGTASSAPASVFGRLVRGAQPHMARLERDRRGAYVALDRRLGEVMGGISSFPRTLTLEDQGLFALGFYHQRAFDRMQAAQRAEHTPDVEPVLEELAPDTKGDTNDV